MTLHNHRPALALLGLLSLLACRKSDPALPASGPARTPFQSARVSTPAPRPAPPPPPKQPTDPAAPVLPAAATPSARHDPPWTPDRVRTFVLGIHLATREFLGGLFKKREPSVMLGDCYDSEGVRSLAKKADILAFLEKRITDPALPCYVASYFGCTVGDWIGNAGVAVHGGSDLEPFTESRVTIVEQTPDRVVADILEAPMELVIDGVLDREQLGPGEEANINTISRYILSRDQAGVWRISDRQVTFELWECRPR